MQNVADNGDRHARERIAGNSCCRPMREDGAQVKQRLRGMLMHAIARVKNGELGLPSKQPGRARVGMAQDDAFRTKRLERDPGVFEAFAFFDAG
jgi:hypothetical protein